MQTAVRTAPLLPGCYIYRDSKKKILYIGKAKVLRNRVKSYFSNYNRVEEKIRNMIDQARSVEFMVTDSEIEALILESVLIKKYKPKYNSMLVDDKSYAYVKFDRIKTTKPGEIVRVPSVDVVREHLDKSAEYFGPYPDSRIVKRLLRRLRRLFPYCTSNIKVEIPKSREGHFKSKDGKPCFQAQINLCNGACAGLVTRGEYEQNLRNIKKFFKGEKVDLEKEFEGKMRRAAKEKNYELAAKYRNLIRDIKYVGSNLHIDGDIDEVAVMQEKKEKRARAQADLVDRLGFPARLLRDRPDFRMECYDISNIQGTNAVGSMVVFVSGKPEPTLYRRFRIRIKNEPNDFAMMQEVLTRRFAQYLRSQDFKNNRGQLQSNAVNDLQLPSARLRNWKVDHSFSQMPDLIIIDGGKGQLSSAYKILTDFGLAEQIAMVGLAKREEEIFEANEQIVAAAEQEFVLKEPTLTNPETPFTRVLLPRRSEALYLVQRIRDEAHRFAIMYHRKLRSRDLVVKKD